MTTFRRSHAIAKAGVLATAASMALLRADSQSITGKTEQLRLSQSATNTIARVDSLPSLQSIAKFYTNRPNCMFDTQIGEIFKDSPQVIEARLKAVWAPGFVSVAYIENAKTDINWWYQFGLGYDTSFFLVVLAFNDKGIPQTPPYHLPYNCKNGDRIDMKMSATNGYVVCEIIDLDREAYFTGVTQRGQVEGTVISMSMAGTRFVGGLAKSNRIENPTGIFTEIQSSNVMDYIPIQHYDILQPTNLTQVEFFMTEANVKKTTATMAGGLGVFHADTGWVDAMPPAMMFYQTGLKECNVVWTNAYHFGTGTIKDK